MDTGHAKLYLQIQLLSKAELKAVRHHLSHLKQGEDSHLLHLFDLALQLGAADPTQEEPDNELLFKHLFPNEKAAVAKSNDIRKGETSLQGEEGADKKKSCRLER